jgi:hypothetical protein
MILTLTVECAVGAYSGTMHRTIEIDGKARPYDLHVKDRESFGCDHPQFFKIAPAFCEKTVANREGRMGTGRSFRRIIPSTRWDASDFTTTLPTGDV